MPVNPGKIGTAEITLALSDYTSPALIIPYLRSQDAAAVIQELSAALHREGSIPDLLQFYHRAFNREYLCSTATESGWALPHAPVKFLEHPCFAVGRCTAPVQWLAQTQKVHTIFLLAVPETDARTYLAVISGLARLSMNNGLLNAFNKGKDSFEIFEVFKQVALRVTA